MVATPPPIAVRAPLPLLRGTVAAVDRPAHTAVITHGAFDGMPAMTMTFRVPRDAPALHAGDLVTAGVNERTEPWTLQGVRLLPAGRREPPARTFVPVLREGDTVPPTALLDQRGRVFAFPQAGTTTIVSFVYTRCRDARMCPLVAAKFARMQRTLAGTPIRLLTVTLDPAYDTPAVFARYGRAYDADPRVWTLAGGTIAAVDDLAGRLGIATDRSIPGAVAHNEAAVVVDARGTIARIVDGAAWDPDDLAASAREIAGLHASALQRLRLWFATSAGAVCGAAGAAISPTGALALLAGTLAAFGLVARRAFATRRE